MASASIDRTTDTRHRDADLESIAARSNLSVAETVEMLDGFMSALRRAEAGEL